MRQPITKKEKQSIVINRLEKYSLMYGVITTTDKALNEVVRLVKSNQAKKVVDSDTTLMYVLKD